MAKKMKVVTKMARQGDVLIRAAKDVPTGTTEAQENGRSILAHGEVTGHAHALITDELIVNAGDKGRFVSLVKETELHHEEHGTVKLGPGKFEIRRQEEYSPLEIRQVAD